MNLDITMYLIEERIKFTIKEIQDNLKNNSLIFESSFVINYFGKVAFYYMNAGGIEEIFNLISEILKNKEDIINIEDDKIIIKIKFRMGKEDHEKDLNILLKNVSLQMTLKNIDKSLKELKYEDLSNKNQIKELKYEDLNNKNKIKETKEEFKKKLLENVYPVGYLIIGVIKILILDISSEELGVVFMEDFFSLLILAIHVEVPKEKKE